MSVEFFRKCKFFKLVLNIKGNKIRFNDVLGYYS